MVELRALPPVPGIRSWRGPRNRLAHSLSRSAASPRQRRQQALPPAQDLRMPMRSPVGRFGVNRPFAECPSCGHPRMAHLGGKCHCGCPGVSAGPPPPPKPKPRPLGGSSSGDDLPKGRLCGHSWLLRCPSCKWRQSISPGGGLCPECDKTISTQLTLCLSCATLSESLVGCDHYPRRNHCSRCTGILTIWPPLKTGGHRWPSAYSGGALAGPCPGCGTPVQATFRALWDGAVRSHTGIPF